MQSYPSGNDGPHKGRQTVYRGITMRSRTEASAAAYFDSRDIKWEYEPVCYATADGQYLPDFRLFHPDDQRPIFVEVKAAIPADLSGVQKRMEIILGSEPEATLQIFVMKNGELDRLFIYDADMGAGWLTMEEWFAFHSLRSVMYEEFDAYTAAGGTDDIDKFFDDAFARIAALGAE